MFNLNGTDNSNKKNDSLFNGSIRKDNVRFLSCRYDVSTGGIID